MLGEAQQRIRQRIRHEYDAKMLQLRQSLRDAETLARQHRLERLQQLREYDEQYKTAYVTLVESAAADVRHPIPRHMMTRETEQLAAFYEHSFEEGRNMYRHLAKERSRKEQLELQRYMDMAMAWHSKDLAAV